MKLFLETTEWGDNTPNHAYYMDDGKSKMFAYIPVGKNAVFKFKNFIRIDTRGRKFKEITDTHNFSIDEPTVENRWTVTGSKGDVYTVTLNEGVYNCSCSGFKFRGACKHIREISK